MVTCYVKLQSTVTEGEGINMSLQIWLIYTESCVIFALHFFVF